MKYCISFLTVLLVFCNQTFSQKGGSSLLWEISGEQLTTSSYLYGTIHAICPKDLEISPVIESSVKESDIVVLELDMDDPSFMMDMQRLSFNDSMKNLSTSLSQEELALLDDFLMKNYNTEMAQVGILKPIALMSMVLIKSYQCPTTKSVEEIVLKFAAMNEKEIRGLETAQEQMQIFDEIPQEEQINWIIDIIKDSVGTKEVMDKFSEAYKRGDIEEIFILSQETYPEMEIYEDQILNNRNEKWIPKMIDLMNEHSVFFAVGAGHLGGEEGLVKLLREKGYKVVPLELK